MSQCPFHSLLTFENFAGGTPHETIAAMRADHRILWEPDDYATGGHWLLFQQSDIDYVLRTTELFSSGQGPLLDDMPDEVMGEQRNAITFLDPPVHRNFRSLVEYAFRPGLLKEREPVMRGMAREILDRVIDRGSCEFVSEVAIQLPMRVMFWLLGVPPADEQRIVGLTNAMILADDPEFAETRMDGFVAAMQLIDYGAWLAADHRANPRPTIAMDVLEAEYEGERLNDRQFGLFFSSLIGGGIETTRNTLGWAMVEFIRHPDQYGKLQSDLSLTAGAAEEILRYRNPVVYVRRTARADTELFGQRVAKGDKVVCVLGSPNRDPALFDQPDAFDITRPPADTRRNYRTFGGGPHYCLGIHQARMNLNVMLEEIARRIDNPRLLAEPTHARSLFMDGFKTLPLGFDKRPASAA